MRRFKSFRDRNLFHHLKIIQGMTAREFFNHMDAKGLADVPVRVMYRDGQGCFLESDSLGDDDWGYGIEVTEEDGETVVYV